MVKLFTDQLNRKITINYPPRRIVSLVPSQTELLFDLGLDGAVVGVTKFCTHPAAKVKPKTKIGGTKNFRLDVIRELNPDLIIGSKEENYLEGIQALEKEFPVWMSDVFNLEAAYQMITSIGETTDTTEKAIQLVNEIKQGFESLPKKKPSRVLYLIWKSPWMAAGKNTFIDSMLSQNGWINAVDTTRYPELTNEQIQALNPDVILLSSEPFPFKERHLNELRALVSKTEIQLVDGEVFSWYGSRLLEAVKYFEKIGI